MFTIYANPNERHSARKTKHLEDHAGCNFFLPECTYYTQEKLIVAAYQILDDVEAYSQYFPQDSLWRNSDVFVNTRSYLIKEYLKFHNEQKYDLHMKPREQEKTARYALIEHLLESGNVFNMYDAYNKLFATEESVLVHNHPLSSVLVDRVHVAVNYLMFHKNNVEKYL